MGQLVVFDTAVFVMVRHWSSSIFHEPLPDDRLRDPFPLPRLKQRGIAAGGCVELLLGECCAVTM